ncbi:TraR/DksA C4-type zinc finger protein [Streptomyces sp. NBC_01216]|uniref:TraR/DksA family transcriptional regulator n=1 Tax=Streptomyces sp. NBC_01216 TaxID=2903778 RepID=UPI002E12425E|nr:TraR/DksA C4-type zinc finger protein [Streptomyces sp. NBC_01216]
MVAKKTAAKKTSAAGTTDADGSAKDVAGKTTTVAEKAGAAAPADTGTAPRAASAKKTATKRAATKRAAGTKKAARTERAATAEADGALVREAARTAQARRNTVGEKAASAAHVEKTGARTVAAKKTAGGATTVEDEAVVPPARAGELAVRPGEDPWTPEEVAEARAELESEVLRLRSELVHSQEELTGLMRDSGDGAGDDQADTGTKNITREHELALAANAREMLEQSEHALERLDAGTYGLCEVCGNPIGKARMQAFPRATLCVEDKQKQERRG